MTIHGNDVLDTVAAQLRIDLAKLVAGCAFFSPVSPEAAIAVYPNIRRARSGEKRGTVTREGIRLDDNTYANNVIKALLAHQGKFEGFAVCHIWPQTCYNERYHTMPANLVLLPRELAGLTDHNRSIEKCLQYRAWELYGWHPDEQMPPEKPANYPNNWRAPASKPVPVNPYGSQDSIPVSDGRHRDALPIVLEPSDRKVFRSAFIRHGSARMSIHYENGRVEDKMWLRQDFGPTSNVIGNLRSRPNFRAGMWQQLGIKKVIVSVPAKVGAD